MARAILTLALLALALAPTAALADHVRTETVRYVSTQTNWAWYQPHAATCDSPVATDAACFRIETGETSVAVRIVDNSGRDVWGTAVLTDSVVGGLGATVWEYQHFCGSAALAIPEGATRLEVYLQPGGFECGASARVGTVVASFQ